MLRTTIVAGAVAGMVLLTGGTAAASTPRQWRRRPVTTRTTTQVLGFSAQMLSCRVTAVYLGVMQTSDENPDVCANPENHPPGSLFF